MKTQWDLLNEATRDKYWNFVFQRMPANKVEAFERQFSWVRNYVKDPISQVYVQGVDPELIDLRLAWKEGRGDEVVFLLDENFKLVISDRTETVMVGKYQFLGFRFGPKVPRSQVVHFDGTTTFSIRSALEELGEKGKLVRIILSYWEYTQAAIIYKLPKGDNLKDWFDWRIEAERTGFEKAFNEI